MALCAGEKAPWKNSEPDNDDIDDNEDNLKCFSTGNRSLFGIKWEHALLSGRLSRPYQIHHMSGKKRSIIIDAEWVLRLPEEERQKQGWRTKRMRWSVLLVQRDVQVPRFTFSCIGTWAFRQKCLVKRNEETGIRTLSWHCWPPVRIAAELLF